MKQYGLICAFSFLSLFSFAQQNLNYQDPFPSFEQAKEYFQKGQYNLAYPLFKELQQNIKEGDKANNALVSGEIEYYTTVLSLKQNEARAEYDANQFMDLAKDNARVQMMSFHLAEYYFRKQQFSEAVDLYEKANIANLSNTEIADMKFHQGYSYFNLKNFALAKPLFNEIRQLPNDPNYIDANYYYGFIAFRDKNYGQALESFRVVENHSTYEATVPYYIAQIYYVQGKKDEAIKYAESKLAAGKAKYYDLELKQLLGHAYFEKGNMQKHYLIWKIM